jgi:hypothetical protein
MTPMQYISTKYLAMKPDSLYTRQFEVHFVPQGVAGNTLIIYSFFDRDHLADSAFFSIMYVTQSSGGIPDQESLNFQVGATPNPAINSVRFKGIPAGFDGQLVIANLLGKRIMEIQVLNKAAEPVVDVAELPEGIYFYFLEKANAKGSAGKLIIRR